ncbi:hypothetical protein CRUP_014541 [Coryphaenoides rupestris]|nr:hypothetical protein CRUP_014541 [Coryphaenoides rupestris]
MTRAVACTLRPARGSNHTRALRDQECPPTKPGPVQACNRFDCPPLWDTREWGKCSQSCGGGGVQRREVACKQHLADGSALALPDTFCPSLVPAGQQPCARQDCPAQWVTGVWSQCSVSCGKGVQRVETECAMQGQDGRIRTLSLDACAALPPPTSSNRLELAKPDPTILAQSKVYVQLRKAKRLQFQMQVNSFRFSDVKHQPPMRMDDGTWSHQEATGCAAKAFRVQATDFLPAGDRAEGVERDPDRRGPRTGRPRPALGPFCLPGLRDDGGLVRVLEALRKPAMLLRHASDEREFRRPRVVLLLLLLSRQPRRGGVRSPRASRGRLGPSSAATAPTTHLRTDASGCGCSGGVAPAVGTSCPVAGSFHPHRRRSLHCHGHPCGHSDVAGHRSHLDSTLRYPVGCGWQWTWSLPVLQTEKLDAVLQRLSEGPGGPWEEPAVTRLLGELLAAQADANESTLHPPERAEASATPGPPPLLDGPDGGPRAPVIVQWPRKVGVAAASEVTVPVGTPVRLQRPVASVELRVDLQPDGSLRIRSPDKGDEGAYTCTANNHHGSASATSRLQVSAPTATVVPPTTMTEEEEEEEEEQRGLGSGSKHMKVAGGCLVACSASCGGAPRPEGDVREGPDHRPLELGSERCVGGAGRRPPSDTRPCNPQPCASWTSGHWGARRSVQCQETAGGAKAPHRLCAGLQSGARAPWTQCTATCGRHGFQSRHVACVHPRTGRGGRDHQCARKPRPPSWQRCNLAPCGKADECRDSTRYCEKVRQLQLCHLPQFKTRCCQSCRDT